MKVRRVRFLGAMALLSASLLTACVRTAWRHPPVGRMEYVSLVESSGVAASRRFQGVLWTHNDDAPAELFAIRENGQLISEHVLPGVENSDWEDIFVDAEGRIYVFDNTIRSSGDYSGRLNILAEPDPFSSRPVESVRTVRVQFPPGGWDVEALMVWKGEAFFVNKPWSGSPAGIFRMRSLESDGEAELVGTVPVRAMITGADISADGTRIALSSYTAVFVFEGSGDPLQILQTQPVVCPINARQIEGITWQGADLILTNEQREVFHVRESQWLNRECPSIQSVSAEVPRVTGKPRLVEHLEDWASGRWLSARIGNRSVRIGRVVWSPEGLHIGVQLPSDFALAVLGEEQDARPSQWVTPGRLYVLINPAGNRPVVYGEDDRCIVVGVSNQGRPLWQGRRVAPATVTESQETRPPWVDLERQARVLLITLNRSTPGFSSLWEGRRIGFNLLLTGEEGEQISWTPLLTPFSFDSPSYWGLLELK